jgi:hypothetical protein
VEAKEAERKVLWELARGAGGAKHAIVPAVKAISHCIYALLRKMRRRPMCVTEEAEPGLELLVCSD